MVLNSKELVADLQGFNVAALILQALKTVNTAEASVAGFLWVMLTHLNQVKVFRKEMDYYVLQRRINKHTEGTAFCYFHYFHILMRNNIAT